MYLLNFFFFLKELNHPGIHFSPFEVLLIIAVIIKLEPEKIAPHFHDHVQMLTHVFTKHGIYPSQQAYLLTIFVP